MILPRDLLDKGFSLTDARDDDFDAYYRISRACYEPYVDEYFGGWVEDFQLNMNTEHFRKNFSRTCFKKISLCGEVVGFFSFDEQADKIDGISVQMLDAARGMGIGSFYLRHITAIAEAGGKPIFLQVFKTNPARHLYGRFGFEIYGENESHFLMRYAPKITPHVSAIKRQYDFSLAMLRDITDACPEELLTSGAGLFPFWQQVYHALYWTDYNLQESRGGEKIFSWRTEKKITHEHDAACPDCLTKADLLAYFVAVFEKKERFFCRISDAELFAPIPGRTDGCTLFDIITNQIRHIMYHAGYCDGILRENGVAGVAWVSIFGRMER